MEKIPTNKTISGYLQDGVDSNIETAVEAIKGKLSDVSKPVSSKELKKLIRDIESEMEFLGDAIPVLEHVEKLKSD